MTDKIDLQVTLDSVDITSHVPLDGDAFEHMSAINDELDTLRVNVRNGDLLGLNGWQDIKVLDGSDVLFGGYTLTTGIRPGVNLAKNDVPVGASDYAAYLKKVYVQVQFTDKTDKEMLAAIFSGTDELVDYDGSSLVTAIRSFPTATFNLWDVYKVISWLATQAGAYWYVDANKKLHYFADAEFRAPFDINTDLNDADNARCENFNRDNDHSNVVNLIELVGGNALSGDKTYKFTKTGIGVDLWLNKLLKPWTDASKIAVRRNDGGATTNLAVNPSFENNITDGWTQSQEGTGAAWALDATKYSVGTKSAKITAGTGKVKLLGGNITLAPGEPLSAQVLAWISVLGMNSLVIYDVTGATILAETVGRKASSWERLTATYINTSAASMTVRVELRNNANDSTTAAWFDCVQVEKLAWPSAYTDGTLGTGYAWTSTAHNSTSTRVNMPVWRTLTVKTGNTDTLGSRDEVLWFESSGQLTQETNWPTISDAIEVDGQEATPVHVVMKNYASYRFYGNRWFKDVIIDETITDPITARIRCATELAKFAYETAAISFDVRKPGLKAGQIIGVHLPHRHTDGDFMITRVSTRFNIGGYILAHVEVGVMDPNLVGLLLQLKQSVNAGSAEIMEDIILRRVLDFVDEVTLEDDGIVITRTSPPYVYGTGKCGYSTFA
jgi:hypothetical protein